MNDDNDNPNQYDVITSVRRMIIMGAARASSADDLRAVADTITAYNGMQDWLVGGVRSAKKGS